MSTFEKLLQVCDAVFEGDIDTSGITPESSLKDDIGINSVGMLYMAMALEEELGVRFKNDDFIGMNTVQDVIDCLDRKLV